MSTANVGARLRRKHGQPVVIDLYCRLSRDNDGTLRTVEDQEQEGRDWIEDHEHLGLVVGMVHRDHAKSAWKRNVVREEFLELVRRLRSGEAQAVWVLDLTRYSRKVVEGEALLELASDYGVEVYSAGGEHEVRTAAGRKRFRQGFVDNVGESDQISERSSRGKRNKAKRGRSNATVRGFARSGYLRPPGGYQPGAEPHRVPCPDEQVEREVAAVRDAAERILAGEHLNVIASEWNAEGLTTTAGGLWDGGIMRQMLSKPSIAGLVVYRGEVIDDVSLPGEPVLAPETWHRLQSFFKSRKRGRPATKYLLSGIARCGVCGHPLTGRPSPNGRDKFRVDGSPRSQYYCQARPSKPGACGRIRIDQRLADGWVRDAVLDVLGDPKHVDQVARVSAKVQSARTKIEAELKRQREIGEGIAEKASVRGNEWVEKAMGPIDKRVAELLADLKALGTPEDPQTAEADSTVTFEAWEGTDPETALSLAERRAMVQRAFPAPRGVWVMPATLMGRAAKNDWTRVQYEEPPVSTRVTTRRKATRVA